MPKKDNEIVRHDDAPLDAIPSYLAEEGGMLGFEKMERSDMTLPRLGLCQSMTPQRKESNSTYIEGLKEGDYFNTITGERFGKLVQITPLLFYKTRIRFFPLDQGGGIRCQARDYVKGVGDPGGNCETCPFGQFINGKKPDCNKFFNYPGLAWPEDTKPGPHSLLVVSFKSTGLKAAAAWNSLMNIRRRNMFTGVYRFTSAIQKNTAGQEWFSPVIKNAGWVSESVLSLVKNLFDAVNKAQQEGRLREDLDQVPAEGQTEL
jgi:hypothetical protein